MEALFLLFLFMVSINKENQLKISSTYLYFYLSFIYFYIYLSHGAIRVKPLRPKLLKMVIIHAQNILLNYKREKTTFCIPHMSLIYKEKF